MWGVEGGRTGLRVKSVLGETGHVRLEERIVNGGGYLTLLTYCRERTNRGKGGPVIRGMKALEVSKGHVTQSRWAMTA